MKKIITLCTLIPFLLACQSKNKDTTKRAQTPDNAINQEKNAPYLQILKKYGMNDPYISLTQYRIDALPESGLGKLIGTEKIILDKERLKPSFLEFYDTDGNGKADATLFKVQVRGGEYKIVLIGLVHGSEVYKKVEPQLKGISPFDPLPMISQKYKPSN